MKERVDYEALKRTSRLHSPFSISASPMLLRVRHPESFSLRYSTREPEPASMAMEQSSMMMHPDRLMPPMTREPVLREAQAQQLGTLGRDTILL